MSNEININDFKSKFLKIDDFDDVVSNVGTLSDAIRYLWICVINDVLDVGFSGVLGAVANTAERLYLDCIEFECNQPDAAFIDAYDKLTPDEREKVLQYVDLIISAREVG